VHHTQNNTLKPGVVGGQRGTDGRK